MIPVEGERYPGVIRVCVAPTEESVTAYFSRVKQNNTNSGLAISHTWAFEFFDEKSNSRLYLAGVNNEIYVPWEVFGGKTPPVKIFVAVGVLS
jgi:hypothetical protein